MDSILFLARPSLRRFYLLAILYAGAVLYGRVATNLDPRFNPLWWVAFYFLLAAIALALLLRFTTIYVITENEISSSAGILRRRYIVIPMDRVTNAVFNQSFIDIILGIVTLQIDSAGGDAKEMVFTRILKPEALKAAAIIRQKRAVREGANATVENADL